MEQWKPIRKYEGIYEISECGNIRRILNRYGNIQNKIIKPSHTPDGYFKVRLSKNGIYEQPNLHRIIYEAFVRDIPHNMQVNHKDFDKENNSLNNLEIVTAKENIRHTLRNSRHRRCISVDMVQRIRRLYSVVKHQKIIANYLGLKKCHVQMALSGKSWQYL